jgi:transposase
MTATFQIPLDIPDVAILSLKDGDKGELIFTVESTKSSTHCHRCQREISAVHGHDSPIRLRHLPVLERVVYIELRPKRYRCPHCEGGPTTTQRLEWYTAGCPHTKAFDRWLLKMLINSTVSDVSRRCGVGYDAVDGAIQRQVGTTVDWSKVPVFTTLGLDEIALRKGHKDFVCVVTALNAEDKVIVLAILPDRLKQTVRTFLESMPPQHKAGVRRVCSDMYEGFLNAAKETLPNAGVVVDRFHVAKQYNKGVDNLRKATLKALKACLSEEAYKALKGVMWPFRRHFWELKDKEDQQKQLAELFCYAPDLKEAWLLRHELFVIYESPLSPEEAGAKFDGWRQKVSKKELTCFDGFIQLLDKHKVAILNYFDGRHTSGFVEGMNNKLKIIKRRCFGLLDAKRLFQRVQIDLMERTGWLTMPNTTCCG